MQTLSDFVRRHPKIMVLGVGIFLAGSIYVYNSAHTPTPQDREVERPELRVEQQQQVPIEEKVPAIATFEVSGLRNFPRSKIDPSRKPKLVIVPEFHFAESSTSARERLVFEARNGLIALTTEGASVGNRDINFKEFMGIEDSQAHHFLNTVMAFGGFRHFQGKIISQKEETPLLSLAANALWQPEAERLWKNSLRTKALEAVGKTENWRQFVNLVDGLYRLPTIQHRYNYFGSKQGEWIAAFPQVVWFLESELNSELTRLEQLPRDQRPDLTIARKLVNGETVPLDDVSLYTFGYRETRMLQNLVAKFLEAGSEGEDVYVVLGAGHAARFYHALRESFDRSGGQDINIVIDDSAIRTNTDAARARERERFLRVWSSIPKAPAK